MLFDLATARLLEAKVLLPGATVLARLIASVREQAAIGLWESLGALPDTGQARRLARLLVVADVDRTSALDRLRHAHTGISAAELLGRCNGWRRSGRSGSVIST